VIHPKRFPTPNALGATREKCPRIDGPDEILPSSDRSRTRREFIFQEGLHANSIIPIRSWNNDIIGGTYRQEMVRQFNDTIYPRRQLVENKFCVLKRKFSGDLKARRFLIQTKEVANKMIVCNIHRFLQFLIIEVFYSAHFSSVLLY
jgi:hypothetical protein